MFRSIAIIFILFIVTGCATSGRIGDLPTITENQPSSSLVIIRVSSIVGGANSYYAALDGKDIFTLRSGEYTKFRIPSGEHYISVKCFGGWTPTWKKESTQFKAIPNQSNYFEISPSMSCAKIKPIEVSKAKEEMNSNDFISPDTVSDKEQDNSK